MYGYEEELLWKDAAYGPVLLADPASGIAPILHRSGVAESPLEGPLGRLPKQNLDSTISTEGCPINDTRLQNAQGPSIIMLLPPSLDIAELHDSLCGGMHAIPGSHSEEECPESFLMAFPPAAIGPLVCRPAFSLSVCSWPRKPTAGRTDLNFQMEWNDVVPYESNPEIPKALKSRNNP